MAPVYVGGSMKKKNNILDELEEKNGKFILKLIKPIEFGSEEITELELIEPKAKHIRKLPANPTTDDVLKIIGQLSNQSDSVIDEISLKDVARLSEFVEVFS